MSDLAAPAPSTRRGRGRGPARPWAGHGLPHERWLGPLFIAPALLFLCAVILFPLGHALWTSLQRTRGVVTSFVGLQNYERVLADEAFWNSLRVSLTFTASCVIPTSPSAWGWRFS